MHPQWPLPTMHSRTHIDQVVIANTNSQQLQVHALDLQENVSIGSQAWMEEELMGTIPPY